MRKRALMFCAVLFFMLGSLWQPAMAADDGFTFGMLLVGPYNDRGWSQANFEGGQYVEAKIPGTKMIYLDKVNPADRPGFTIPQLVDDLISKGAKLIIATSDDMKDGIRESAAQHPDIPFLHASGDDFLTGKASKNLGNVMGKMEYTKMMAGFVAAMTSQTGKIGYVGPLINEETRRLVASAYLGAKYAWVNVRKRPVSELNFKVSWIGFWFNIPGVTADPTQVASSMIDSGFDVLISGIDTPEAASVASQKRKAGKEVWAVPYDFKGGCQGVEDICLGVPYFNWGPAYLKTVKAVMAGTWNPSWDWNNPDWKDLNNLDTTAVGFETGPALAADAKAELDKFIAGLASGDIALFKGPLNYQDGSAFLKDGETATDEQIWYLPQLLEGMEGLSSAK